MSILAEIFAHKKEEVAGQKRRQPLQAVIQAARSAPAPLDFAGALARSNSWPALIAEIKKASPSRGLLVANFDPLRLAQIYRQNGAAAISVVTDERFFLGGLEMLAQVRAAGLGLPLLRKDFLCDPYQVYQARAAGADAVLLIAASLEPGLLFDLHALALELEMAPLVEVHAEVDLGRALDCDPLLVGINNRDLATFQVDLETTFRLLPQVPPGIHVVAESGIHAPEDVRALAEVGVSAVLVGEALVTGTDVAAKVRSLACP